MSYNSSINTKDIANYLNHMVSKLGLEQHLKQEDNQEFSFNFTNPVTLQVGADGGGGDSTTVNTDCSAVTWDTTKEYLKPPINYLAPLVPVSQVANQPGYQVASQVGNQGKFQRDNQGKFQPVSQSINLSASQGVNQAGN